MNSIIINQTDNISTTIGEFVYNHRQYVLGIQTWHIGILMFADMIKFIFDNHRVSSVTFNITDTKVETIYKISYGGVEFNPSEVIVNLPHEGKSTLSRIWLNQIKNKLIDVYFEYHDEENELVIRRKHATKYLNINNI